jgi:dTDP-4-amino-4,6-dideoxygalactose transaminase
MTVSPIDLGAAYAELKYEIDEAIGSVFASGHYILGPRVESFEREWASYVEADHCVTVANGLEAIQLALLAVGVNAGDEVIVPANTCIATWLAVTHCGAVPVPVEPDACTYNLDVSELEAAITPKTAAIVPVHLYGQPADLEPILHMAREAGLRVVEDAAQAHGARYRGARIGAHSDAVAWSFYPTKNLGALGDGGAVTTNSEDVARRIRSLRNYGETSKYENEVRGLNSRLDELQAAILSVKLRHLDAANERRRAIAARYTAALQSAPIVVPSVPRWAEPVWHQYVIRVRDRDRIRSQLRDLGVDTLVHYPTPPHLQAAYSDMGMSRGSLPVSEALHQEVLSLPINSQMSDGDVALVISGVMATVA